MRNTSLKISAYSYTTSVGGYGILNNTIHKQLARRGADICSSPDYTPQPGSREWEIMDEEEKTIYQKPFEIHRIGISGTTPFDFHKNKSPVKVAMTMAESDLLGPSWVQACNGMTSIIVPNLFYEEVFRRSGVEVPIKVIPTGVEVERYPHYDRPSREVFTFGICGYLNDRKGAFDLIRAFASEFSPDEPVRLKLHTTNGLFRYFRYYNDPRISISWDYKTFSELNEWYRSLDCFVFPSKAEGIGYPPREAMSTGLPTIVTEYSGLIDICDPHYSYPLSVSRLVPRTDMLEQPGNWAEIDIQELMYRMRYVYEHQEEAKKLGRTASMAMKNRFSWDVCTDKLIDYLESL